MGGLPTRSTTLILVLLDILLTPGLVCVEGAAAKTGTRKTSKDDMSDMLFTMMDKDQDGFLSRSEVEAMGRSAASGDGAKQFGGETDPGGVVFEKLDSNKDGKVSRDEAVAIFAKVKDSLQGGGRKRRRASKRKQGSATSKGEL
uniref:EF-hand domain-containing protein n=1 Tax=Alexandrium andersonii TaxID=327968 RepID=A0A7S2BEE8_9DINO|mmetsp:Transcript_25116/g.57025  ORF Transcript_25116/g.57025 Transcript_25116/m.57025 type:complete len:144 (+) Transcript_25116:143-574(+)